MTWHCVKKSVRLDAALCFDFRVMKSQNGLRIAGLLVAALLQTTATVNAEDGTIAKSSTTLHAGNSLLFFPNGEIERKL